MEKKLFLLNNGWLICLTVIFNIISCWLIPVFAEEASTKINLDKVLQQASIHSPRLQYIEKDYQDKISEAKLQKNFDNPELKIKSSTEKTPSINSKMVEFEVMQPLQMSKILGRKHLYAKLLSNTANKEKKLERLKLIKEINKSYLECWLLQDKRKFYNSFLTDVKILSEVVDSDASFGQVTLAEKYALQADLEKIKAELLAIEVNLTEKIINLSRLTGITLTDLELEKPDWTPISNNYESLVQFAKQGFNYRNISYAKLEAAKSRIENSRIDAWLPEITPKLFKARQRGDEKKIRGFGIDVKIPLWNTNQPEREKAEKEYLALASEIEFNEKFRLEDSIKLLHNAAKKYQLRADLYYNKVISNAQKSYNYSLKRYQTKQINALKLWENRATLLDLQEKALQAIDEAYQMRNLLEIEIGGKLEELEGKHYGHDE